jgi:hypothetical protein
MSRFAAGGWGKQCLGNSFDPRSARLQQHIERRLAPRRSRLRVERSRRVPKSRIHPERENERAQRDPGEQRREPVRPVPPNLDTRAFAPATRRTRPAVSSSHRARSRRHTRTARPRPSARELAARTSRSGSASRKSGIGLRRVPRWFFRLISYSKQNSPNADVANVEITNNPSGRG